MVLLTLFQCLLSVLLVWKILLITGWVSNPVNSWVDYETLWVVLVCPIRQVQIIQYHLTKLYQKYNERLKCWSFYCIVSYAFSACLSLQSSLSSAWCMNSGVICILSIRHDRTLFESLDNGDQCKQPLPTSCSNLEYSCCKGHSRLIPLIAAFMVVVSFVVFWQDRMMMYLENLDHHILLGIWQEGWIALNQPSGEVKKKHPKWSCCLGDTVTSCSSKSCHCLA